MGKILSDLLSGVGVEKVYGDRGLKVSSLIDDSRKIKKGALFVAVKGLTVDGHGYIGEAIEKGVSVVVGERKPNDKWSKKVTYVKVKDSREALGLIATNWFGNPSRKMHVIGVTGTDGKTTTASMIYHILKNAGKRVGLLTTVSATIDDEKVDTGFHVTSPGPIELQEFLAKMVEKNLNYAVLEVTSHGLSQGRVVGVDFETAVLTNITHEHLDYHKTEKDYFNAKLTLFKLAKNFVILNSDDPYSNKISEKLLEKVDVITYGTSQDVQVLASNYRRIGKHYLFNTSYKDNDVEVKLRIPGNFNMENALAAISTCIAYGVTPTKSAQYFLSFTGVKGRMHEIKNRKGLKIYIDFAHTPNSLERSLKFLRKEKKGKLIAVFGCAGERDIEKRITMPEVSVKYADVSVFTAEDPRSEKIEDILKTMGSSAISSGAKRTTINSISADKKNVFLKIPERGEAISIAINKIAKKGDIVAIFGKGHERSMAYNGKEYLWSDFDAVKIALEGKVKTIVRK